MKKFFLTNLLLALLCCNVYSSDKGSIYTYFVTTPNGQDETLFLNYDRNVEVGGKNYQQYVGSYLDRSYADPVLLRREEKKYFYYDSRTSEEHLLFDFDLQKGDAFTDDFSGIVYDVVDVRDSLVNNNLCCLIEIRDCEGTGKHDIWLEDVGSIYTGILPKNKFKDVYLLICFHFDYSIEEDVEHSTYFFPNTPQIKTARMSVTRPQWEKELKTEEDRDEYLTWLHAPTDLNAEFENDTLHIWGTLRTSCSIQTYAACELSGDNITFKVYPYNNLLDEDCISRYEVETRIHGFKRGTYKVNLYNKTLELECAGAEAPHQPLPFLEGNPIWVFKYEHMPTPRSNDWMKYWLDTGDRYFNYYFLGGKKELEGKVYTMMHEVGCDRDGKITFKRSLPVREENGIVYTITDSLPGVDEHYYGYEIPYLQEGDECVLYNFSTEIGEALNPQDEDNLWTVESYSTYQLMDGTECRVLKTHWQDYYYLYEKLGYLNRNQEFGVMDPLSGLLIATNGHVYENLLNAYYQDDTMLYKAPDAPEGLCVNDTCWTRDDAYNYAMSYKANPYHEEVMSYIRQLQKAEEPVTFTKDQMATIILPSAPDASKGKYYRLDRCEDGQIIFEQELQPRAHVPYIIVPDEDFSIDPRAFDLSGLNSDTVSIDGISFIGSYTGEVLPSLGGEGGGSFYIDIIDTTPDCSLSPSEGTGKAAVIGALRAYLLVDWVKLNWNDPYDQGGTKGPWEGMPIVLHDDGNGMIEIENGKFNNQNEGEVANGKWSNGKCYDLSGRKIVNRKSSNSKSHRVIYIVDGKKTMK